MVQYIGNGKKGDELLENEVDEYLVDRIAITDNMSLEHLLEVNGYCPKCGKYLLRAKGSSIHKEYEIAHIYPNSPTKKEKEELKGLERLGENCEDFKNKIALCRSCHRYYDDNKNKDEYIELVKIKKQLINKASTKKKISKVEIEEEIRLIIKEISNVSGEEIANIKLEYKALKISKKIEDKYLMLKCKVSSFACNYYNFIRETFRNYEKQGIVDFDIVAKQVNLAFTNCAKINDDKGDIFNLMVEWVKSKTQNSSTEACEVLVSFFIQDCEVFDEITK